MSPTRRRITWTVCAASLGIFALSIPLSAIFVDNDLIRIAGLTAAALATLSGAAAIADLRQTATINSAIEAEVSATVRRPKTHPERLRHQIDDLDRQLQAAQHVGDEIDRMMAAREEVDSAIDRRSAVAMPPHCPR
jgi:hypothetical protein